MIYLPIVVALQFLLLPLRFASMAPCAAALAALLLYIIYPKDPGRAIAWISVIVAAGVAAFKGAALLFPSTIVALAALGLVEVLSRGRNDSSISQTPAMVLAAMTAVATIWFGLRGNPFESLGDIRNIVAIGDSLTAGVPGDGVSTYWPDGVARRAGGEAVSLSWPGDTTAGAFSRWQNEITTRNWKAGASWQPDAIVVLIGGNDILRKNSPAAFQADLRKLVSALKPGEIPILLVAVPGALFSDAYKEVWREVASEFEGVEYMDQKALRSIFMSSKSTLPDRIHLSQQGQNELADAIHYRLKGK